MQNTNPLVTVGKETIYRDIHIFLECITIYKIISYYTMHQNLSSCMCGTALSWYLTELSASDQEYFMLFNKMNGISHWSESLFKQFKGDVSKAQNAIFTEKYTISDIFNHCEPHKYTNKIIWNSHSASLPAFNQMIAIRDDINIQLCQSISMICSEHTILELFDTLNDIKTDWWAFAEQKLKKWNWKIKKYEQKQGNQLN